MKIDFHIHTKYSVDSLNEPREIADTCRKFGLIPAITDHSSISSFKEFRSLGFKFIQGEECYTAEKFDLTALYVTDFIKPKLGFLECLDIIKSQGALSYIPHMCDTTRHGSGYISGAEKADIIEVFNARCMVSGFNQQALAFATKNKKPMGAGSDAHFIFEIGNAYVEMDDFDMDNPKALLKALKNGKISGRYAPLYVRGTTSLIKFAKRTFKF
ncbi:TPA: PHP domain-containing protein [Candidatus Micrarchaeota archaeon]|nr:PHP domain-containing protein [Candidatus Micrarchaeota archaeon]